VAEFNESASLRLGSHEAFALSKLQWVGWMATRELPKFTAYRICPVVDILLTGSFVSRLDLTLLTVEYHGPMNHVYPDEILDDQNIDAIFIPLPNSIHFEWAVRAIPAGKQILLEKPSVSNAIEANILFNLPELSQPNAPVLLEVFHNRFHPAVHLFRCFFNPADVVHVHTDSSMVPWLLTAKDNIEFNYNLSGGSMMQLGTYNFTMLRIIFNDEPEECLTCDTSIFGDGVHDKYYYDFKAAQFRFPNGGIGKATTSLRGPIQWKPSQATVRTREVLILDTAIPSPQEKALTRQLTRHGFIHACTWHRIDVKDSYYPPPCANVPSPLWQEGTVLSGGRPRIP
jgi:predicted dehydrogenase